MKTVIVEYECDACGNKASKATIENYRNQWNVVSFKETHAARDSRHACSYKCAIAIMKDMIRNLTQNDTTK